MSNVSFIIPRIDGDGFEKYMKPSLNKIGDCQSLEMTEIKDTIFKKCNDGIKVLKEKGMKEDDIIVTVHSDVGILDNQAINKLKMVFEQKKDIGILGVIGSIELSESGAWWQSPSKGHIIQGTEQNDGKGFHLLKSAVGFHNDMIAVDGCFMAFSGKFLLSTNFKFDEETFKDHNDFYDIESCLQCLELGWKVGIADILIFHASQGTGALKESWHQAKDKFINKWKNKGYQFPITSKIFQKNVSVTENSNIIEIEI